PEINYCGYAHFNNLTQQWNCSSQLVSQDFDALISNRVSQGGSTTAVSYSDAYDLLKNNARNPTDAICDSSSQNGLVPPPNPPESSTAEINYQKLADSLIYIFSIRDAVLGPRLLTDEIILKTGLRTTDLTIIGEKVKVRFLGERKIANRECKAFEINLPASEQPRTRTIGCSSITEEPLNATWKVCLDKEYGVALEYSFTEGNRRGSSRSITEFRTATNAADFTLPSNHQVITDDDYWNYFFQP
ncbi:TPA: hypothetical protein HA318_01460, partial [Candidatus Micrarchaeota archaeon]|nr:hypothetical protein [Candidatus Micrarchaeota archaeon]